jgi:hypothetical protein
MMDVPMATPMKEMAVKPIPMKFIESVRLDELIV